MDTGKIAASFAPIKPVAGTAGSEDAAATAGTGFANVLKTFATQAVDAQHQAQSLTLAAAQGDPNVPLQDVVQAIGKAELTLQTLVTVRDKAIEAYQEILRMPI
ncbi:MAG: flagellar hook-basal body complex protein FliE [Pseudomonadaceae bacterium]|nr:flagellar hook-basal body complex protein FliE [Pseudomonadaceae bacterium]